MRVPVLPGGIAGDVIGSKYESFNTRRFNFRLFGKWSRYTDDTVLTVAIADALLTGVPNEVRLREYALKYPDAGYGDLFMSWVNNRGQVPVDAVQSYGCGAAMRVPPVAYWFDSIEETSAAADASAITTHKSGEGFVAARNIARIIYRAKSLRCEERNQNQKTHVLDSDVIVDTDVLVEQLNWPHEIDLHAKTVITHAGYAFYHGHDYESVIRLAISIGGDSDTIATIPGAIACAFYQDMFREIYEGTMSRLPAVFIDVINSFYLAS